MGVSLVLSCYKMISWPSFIIITCLCFLSSSIVTNRFIPSFFFYTCPSFATMAPTHIRGVKALNELIKYRRVLLLSKGALCELSNKVKEYFNELKINYCAIDLDSVPNGGELLDALAIKVGKQDLPQLFIRGKNFEDLNTLVTSRDSEKLLKLVYSHPYDYDFVVIGGGSGGLAASKEASKLGAKVALLDFVTPTPKGTTWGIGGTCVNVGCIPKKLMHHAGLIGEHLRDAYDFGWGIDPSDKPFELSKTVKHNWSRLVEEVQNKVKGSNFVYRVQLRTEKVNYLNCQGSFETVNKLKLVDKKNQVSYITADKFLIAVGERPRYPDIPGAVEHGITSDDLFSLPYYPGKTLIVGASYVALECAGFLNSIGVDVTVMVRSIFLRGFDQEVAEMVGRHMEKEGVKFLRPYIPLSIEKVEEGIPGLLKVLSKSEDGKEEVGFYNTVIFAIGRKPLTDKLNLDKIGVKVNKNGKIPTVEEKTNIDNIYAVGDILEGKPELTPVAIEAGILLARRLFAGEVKQCDYEYVPTTVFTPLEYGCVGLNEEDAIAKYGDDLEVYHQYFTPFEWMSQNRPKNVCFVKLLCVISEGERAVGFHYFGPYAGEVTQLASLCLKKKCTKEEFTSMIGIHPTCAEVFAGLTVTKRSGLSAEQSTCCG